MAKKVGESRSSVAADRRVWLIHQVAAWITLVGSYYVYDRWVVPRWGISLVQLHSIQDRLAYAIRLLTPGLLTILISIFHVTYYRYTNPAARNPLSGNEHVVALSHKVLANTIEQFIIHAGNIIILSTYLSEDRLRLLPLITALFFIGRIAFLIGYEISPNHRSFGFALSFIPNVGALGYNIWFLLTLGPSARLATRG